MVSRRSRKRSPSSKHSSNDSSRTKIFSHRKASLFKVSALLLPIIAILTLELVLRLLHIGYHTSYFLRSRIGGKDYIIENDRFGWLFFPPTIARTPTPFAFPYLKGTNTLRVLVFGESAALGDPRPAVGPWRFLQALLEERLPGVNVEVIPVAMTAINSHALYLIAKEALALNADAWIIYAGNNEFIGPYGATGIFGPAAPNLWRVRAELVLRRIRIVQSLQLVIAKLRASDYLRWTGIELFQEAHIDPDSPIRSRIEKNFEENLKGIVRLAVTHHIPVLLSSVAVNLRDCGPFASLGTNRLDSSMLKKWNEIMDHARRAIVEKQWATASTLLRQAISIAPNHANTHYQLAWCLRAQGKLQQALEHYRLACDLDALPVRITSQLRKAIETVASAFDGSLVRYVDVEAPLRELVADQVPGDEFFFEHVHLKPKGNYQIALAWAQALIPLVSHRVATRPESKWPDFETCCRRLGLTSLNLLAIYEQMLDRISGQPYDRRIHHQASLEDLFKEFQNLRRATDPAYVKNALGWYQQAVSGHGSDPWLLQNYAEFLELVGKQELAVEIWERLLKLWPHHFLPKFQLGKALVQVGKVNQGRQLLLTVVAQQPNFAPGWVELARITMQEGKYAQAESSLRKALRLAPDSSVIYLLLADALAAQGKRSEGISVLEQLVVKKPFHWKAHYLLGLELALQDRLKEAVYHLNVAATLRPDSPLAHENLGVALARLGDLERARRSLRTALELDPNNTNVLRMLNMLNNLLGSQVSQGATPTNVLKQGLTEPTPK